MLVVASLPPDYAWCNATPLRSDEVATASTRLGQTLTSEELDAAMADMDKDHDGTVDFDEFLT
eukprot:COSAG02_NODE_3099_length_7378_cov_3.046984_3_plen_63_part_00